MIVEICASSMASAINAAESGADRIELCSELLLGGVTPSYGLIRRVRERLQIPVYVLVRPRSGGFTYTAEELNIILEDIRTCASLGCDGIVSGALTSGHKIDTPAVLRMLEAAGDADFTFHRAFDWVSDQYEAAETLVRLGCKRVLSSGGKLRAEEGLSQLMGLKEAHAGELSVMPGGGINERNIARFKESGFSEIHFSATKFFDPGLPAPKVSFFPDELPDERQIQRSDAETIRRMVNRVK